MVERNSANLDSVFQALADATRRSMMARLAAEPLTVSALAEPLDMSLAAASKHIRVLERAGLIQRQIEGRLHVCSLEPKALAEADAWFNHYQRFWSGRLDALERALRKPERATAAKPKRRRSR